VVVDVEIDTSMGLPFFALVVLPDSAVKESKVRVVFAIENCGIDLPSKRVTVNLAPADMRKDSTGFDIPIALGVLAAANGIVEPTAPERHLFADDLVQQGRCIKVVRSALPSRSPLARLGSGTSSLRLQGERARGVLHRRWFASSVDGGAGRPRSSL
jgi:magnesium chelatase family protein